MNYSTLATVAPPEPDLFGIVEPPAPDVRTAPRLQFTGTLASHAELRYRIVDPAGRSVPVLCLHLTDVGEAHQLVYAEHAYTEATRPEAESWVKRLRKGMRITVSSGLADIRVTLPRAEFAIDSPVTTTTEEITP